MIYYPIFEKGFDANIIERGEDYAMSCCHTHEHYEIFMVIEGSCRMNVFDKLYEMKPGDVALIKPGISHYNFGQNKHKRLCVEFSDEYISSYFTGKAKSYLYECFEAEMMHLSERKVQELTQNCEKLLIELKGEAPHTNPLISFLILSRIISEFTVAYKNCIETDLIRTEAPQGQSVNRLSTITGYIAHHFTTIDSLEEIAQACFVSKSHMCRIFRSELGVSVVSYINTLKLRYACELLRLDKLSTVEIARECGFNSSQYFSRIFRKMIKMTPQEYRRMTRHVKHF